SAAEQVIPDRQEDVEVFPRMAVVLDVPSSPARSGVVMLPGMDAFEHGQVTKNRKAKHQSQRAAEETDGRNVQNGQHKPPNIQEWARVIFTHKEGAVMRVV